LLGIGLRAIRMDSGESELAFPAARADLSFVERLYHAGLCSTQSAVRPQACDAAIDTQGFFDALAKLQCANAPRILLLGPHAVFLGTLIKQNRFPAALVCVVAGEVLPADAPTHIRADARAACVPPQDDAKFLLLSDRIGPDMEDVLGQSFDLVCVVNIHPEGQAQALINLATRAVGPAGVILGQEGSAGALRAVMGLLHKETHDRDLATAISGCAWRSRPLPLGFA
jgi:hypothetical protein